MKPDKTLLIGGLVFLVISMIGSSIHGAITLPRLLQDRQSTLIKALDSVASEQPDQAKSDIKRFLHVQEVRELASSSHSHLALFGLIALAGAPVLRESGYSKGVKLCIVWGFLIGGFLLPGGLFLRVFEISRPGFWASMAGGILVLLGTIGLLAGALSLKGRKKS